jgi:hypothetical protein
MMGLAKNIRPRVLALTAAAFTVAAPTLATQTSLLCSHARRIAVMYKPLGSILLATAALFFSPLVRAQQAAETPQSMLAA